MPRVVVTGADGFIGRNLLARLQYESAFVVHPVRRSTPLESAIELVQNSDFLIHLAGVNRPPSEEGFQDNFSYLESLLRRVDPSQNAPTVLLSSSIQATNGSPYGESKLRTEQTLNAYAERTGAKIGIFRLPNVFGKWGKPNYNSAVNTFCYNLARGLPITVHQPDAPLRLVYIDDVIDAFCRFLSSPETHATKLHVLPEYETTVGQVADLIRRMVETRTDLFVERVGSGFERAIYATLVSYLPQESFSYSIPSYTDARGTFVEMLRFRDSGQFSFFTAHPGVTRGGHFHHTKIEKFLVLQGSATFRFRNLQTDEVITLQTIASNPKVVESIPGWAHDVTNTGETDLICMLWANEVFDRNRPDTYSCKVEECRPN